MAGLAHGAGDGGDGGAPPLAGVLLGPGRAGVRGGQRGVGVAAAAAVQVEQRGADALGADVEAEEERRGGGHPAAVLTGE
jgi:hypothetical protein